MRQVVMHGDAGGGVGDGVNDAGGGVGDGVNDAGGGVVDEASNDAW